MARESNWSLSIETGIEVKKESFDKASRIFDAFYNKYSDKSVKVDTSDLISTVKDSINTIKQLYNEGTATPTSWLNIHPQMKEVFEATLSDAEEMFSNIKVLFNNGEYVGGMENILRGFRDQLSIVFSDIGGLYDELNQRQKDLNNTLGNISFYDGYFTVEEMQERVSVLRELAKIQEEMHNINPNQKDEDFESGYTANGLRNRVKQHQQAIEEMRQCNLLTTEHLERRRALIAEINAYTWDSDDQDNAKENKTYDKSIESLKEYIDERRQLMSTLESEEYNLFSVDGIDGWKAKLNGQIDTLEMYKKELEELRDAPTNDAPIIGGNLSEVVDQLKEIKEAINAIKVAFEPLTNALSSEDNALHKMLATSIEDLNTLESRLKDVYQMIDTISKKDFNVTNQNVISKGSTSNTQADLELIRQLRKEASATYKQVEELYTEALGGTSQTLIRSGNMEAIMEFQRAMSDFNLDDLAKRTRSRSAASLGIVTDELAEWKQVLLQFNELRNKINAGSFDASKYATKPAAVVEKASGDISADIVKDDSSETKDILNEVKSLSEQIEEVLTSIRSKMEATFDFSTIDPKIESVKAITDTIYQQFEELQAKIKALDLNLEIPTIVAKVDEKETFIDNGSAETSANEINSEAEAMQDVKNEAEGAANAKEKFAEANKKVAKTAKDTSEKVEEETKKMEEAAGAIVKASDKFDKIKYVEDADGNPMSKTTTSTTTRQNAIETESSYYTYDDDGDPQLQAVTIVKDFKKRAAELKKEADKIALAQKTVDKFLSQFESKTAGQAGAIKGFDGEDGLKNFKIANLDDIEKATQKMLELDNEYNKITKNFRQGTKSMNPFVNAITGIDEMGNKIHEVQLNFNKLSQAPDDLVKEVASLNPLLEQMKGFIGKDQNGNKIITDIYGLAEAYGKLNVALRKANSDIDIRSKIEAAAEKEGKQSKKLYEDTIKLQDKLYKAKKQLAVVDEESVQGQELSRKVKEIQKEYDANMELLKGKIALIAIRQREVSLQQELDATAAEKARTEQAEKLLSSYKEYADLRESIARMDGDSSGKVHDQERAKAIQDMADAARKLKDNYGIDVSDESSLFESLSDNNILTQKQMIDLLDEDIKRRQTIVNLMRKAADAESSRLKKEQQKQEKQNQNYGKTIYNREARYFETIGANERKLSEIGLSEGFAQRIEEYKAAFAELKNLRDKFANDPDVFNSEALKKSFQDATIKVEDLRKEILSTFKEAQKFEQLSASGAILENAEIDTDKFADAKSAMVDFAATVTNGQFKFEGFNTAGTEMYGTLDKGAGVVEKVTVALRSGTNQLYAYQSGTKQVADSWGNLKSELSKGIKQIVGMYFGIHEAIQAVRTGLTYVKEIDLAMTELKKVTDETDETYKKFLQTASSTSAVIGSTVSDFTDATAAFARLGYSIDESSKMAETAIVYKNVADGLDTVEEATDSIISTMMAYGIEADNTMSIIDKFNAVKFCRHMW